MTRTLWTGRTAPTRGDALLSAWETYDGSAMIPIPAASLAEARRIMKSAPDGSFSSDKPLMFLIQGLLYFADGSKEGAHFYLRPINQTAGILHEHWDRSNQPGRTNDDPTVQHFGQGQFTLPARTMCEFTFDACVSVVVKQFDTEEKLAKATGAIKIGFSLDGGTIWQSTLTYDRWATTHQKRWVQEIPSGSHTVSYWTQPYNWGAQSFWNYSPGAWPGARFRVSSLGLVS